MYQKNGLSQKIINFHCQRLRKILNKIFGKVKANEICRKICNFEACKIYLDAQIIQYITLSRMNFTGTYLR